jgi:hypothetical protein
VVTGLVVVVVVVVLALVVVVAGVVVAGFVVVVRVCVVGRVVAGLVVVLTGVVGPPVQVSSYVPWALPSAWTAKCTVLCWEVAGITSLLAVRPKGQVYCRSSSG